MLYIKLFIEREKNTGQSAPECPFNRLQVTVINTGTVYLPSQVQRFKYDDWLLIATGYLHWKVNDICSGLRTTGHLSLVHKKETTII